MAARVRLNCRHRENTAFLQNLLSAKVNQAAGLAAQKGGKMTVFSFCYGVSPYPNWDHRCCRKTKTTEETATKMAAKMEMSTG
jgi:hypothetical protein